MHQVRVEGQQQCGAFLNDADPGALAAVDTALVPFGLFKPALQIEVVLLPPHTSQDHVLREIGPL